MQHGDKGWEGEGMGVHVMGGCRMGVHVMGGSRDGCACDGRE